MKRRAEFAFSGALFLIFAYAVYESRGWQFHARLLPWVVGLPMMALALWQLLVDLRRAPAREPTASDNTDDIPAPLARQRAVAMVLWLLGLFAAIWLLGFAISIPLFTFCYLKWESKESWLLSAILTFCAWLFLYGLFDWTLKIPFPPGVVIELLTPSGN